MSAALQLPLIWAAAAPMPRPRLLASATRPQPYPKVQAEPAPAPEAEEPATSWAFYRRHTENLLRRYLYASMQVGRAPNLLDEPVGRGWASSRKIKTFEDALIFVLDIERCLEKLSQMDRYIIQRIVLQEYTHHETATMLRTVPRTILARLHRALDRLSEHLVESGVLMLPG